MLENNYSFFLFGARGVGKSTLLKQRFEADLIIDLLDPREESRFMAHPEELLSLCQPLEPKSRVLIDEIQKIPSLLDAVHKLIEERQLIFALSGSSARKLKRKGANLLAGRAFLFHLFPLTSDELGPAFDLNEVLSWGSLPKLCSFSSSRERKLFLESYVQTYLREEIRIEQLVRNTPAFTRFLEVAAQMNGKPLNYSRIGKDVGIDHSVVRTYFDILEDTLVGNSLYAFDKSVRHQVRQSKKFYFFDLGVKRELEGTAGETLRHGTYEYGRQFEHFLILEVMRRIAYRKSKERLSYLLTKDDVEVDLVIEQARHRPLFIEIKSADHIGSADVRNLVTIAKDHDAEAVVVSKENREKDLNGVRALPWQKFLLDFFPVGR